jgi:hypothetical protein
MSSHAGTIYLLPRQSLLSVKYVARVVAVGTGRNLPFILAKRFALFGECHLAAPARFFR